MFELQNIPVSFDKRGEFICKVLQHKKHITKPLLIVLKNSVGKRTTDCKHTVSTELNSDERIARENNCNVEYSTDAHPDHKPYQQEHMLYESSHICVKSLLLLEKPAPLQKWI